MSRIRWSVVLSETTDKTLRTYLASTGMKKGAISDYSIYYSRLLSKLYKDNKNAETFKVSSIDNAINNLIHPLVKDDAREEDEKYIEQWKLWCAAIRFGNFGKDENIGSFILSIEKIEPGLKSFSFRAQIINAMADECHDKKIKKMWELRRSLPAMESVT